MRLLIDGYNLLHATDLFGSGALAGTLRGSREALLRFLTSRLSERERRAAVVVFDARDAPPGLPSRYEHDGLRVWFARDYPDADALIEEILETSRETKGMTVVSGDRRVQRAARSRGATPVESDAWFTELDRREASTRAAPAKPIGPVSDNAAWIREFSDAETLARITREAAEPPRSSPVPRPVTPPDSPAPPSRPKRRRRTGEFPTDPTRKEEFGRGILNPFPPGYGDDVVDE